MHPNDPRRAQIWYDFGMHVIRSKSNTVKWRGIRVVKLPQDLILYAQTIWENKPDIIIETGTCFGGSALFFADMLEINGKGTVLTIDRHDRGIPPHPRVKYFLGRSDDPAILAEIEKLIEGKSVMASLDSLHTAACIKMEVEIYSKFITPGQFLVVEDLTHREGNPGGGLVVVDEFLEGNIKFKRVPVTEQFMDVAVSRFGWLKRC